MRGALLAVDQASQPIRNYYRAANMRAQSFGNLNAAGAVQATATATFEFGDTPPGFTGLPVAVYTVTALPSASAVLSRTIRVWNSPAGERVLHGPGRVIRWGMWVKVNRAVTYNPLWEGLSAIGGAYTGGVGGPSLPLQPNVWTWITGTLVGGITGNPGSWPGNMNSRAPFVLERAGINMASSTPSLVGDVLKIAGGMLTVDEHIPVGGDLYSLFPNMEPYQPTTSVTGWTENGGGPVGWSTAEGGYAYASRTVDGGVNLRTSTPTAGGASPLDILPGRVYGWQANVRVPAGRTANLRFEWRDAQNVAISNVTPAGVSTNGTWMNLTVSGTAPSNAARLFRWVQFNSALANEQVHVRRSILTDWQVPYDVQMDGDTPGWAWSGTPGAAASAGYPLTLEQIAGRPVAWYDARHINGLGIASPLDGSEVTTWKSLTGKHDLTNATATRRPLYRATPSPNLLSYRAATFDMANVSPLTSTQIAGVGTYGTQNIASIVSNTVRHTPPTGATGFLGTSFERVPVVEGRSYTLEATWARIAGSVPSVTLRFEWRDAAGTFISATNSAVSSTPGRISLTATAPAGALLVNPVLYLNGYSAGTDIVSWENQGLYEGSLPAVWRSPLRLSGGTMPTVQFDGIDDYLQAANQVAIGPELTVYAVVSPNEFKGASGVWEIAQFISGATKYNRILALSNGWYRRDAHDAAGTAYSVSTPTAPAAPTIVTATSEPTGHRARLNGKPENSGLTTAGANLRFTAATLTLGARDSSLDTFAGAVSALIVFDGYHSPATQRRVEGWLARTYGLHAPWDESVPGAGTLIADFDAPGGYRLMNFGTTKDDLAIYVVGDRRSATTSNWQNIVGINVGATGSMSGRSSGFAVQQSGTNNLQWAARVDTAASGTGYNQAGAVTYTTGQHVIAAALTGGIATRSLYTDGVLASQAGIVANNGIELYDARLYVPTGDTTFVPRRALIFRGGTQDAVTVARVSAWLARNYAAPIPAGY